MIADLSVLTGELAEKLFPNAERHLGHGRMRHVIDPSKVYHRRAVAAPIGQIMPTAVDGPAFRKVFRHLRLHMVDPTPDTDAVSRLVISSRNMRQKPRLLLAAEHPDRQFDIRPVLQFR